MEIILIGLIVIFIVSYRTKQGESVYKFISQQAVNTYKKLEPYSFKIMREKVHHSGAGRIGKLNMYTMSLYESGDSSGEASLTKMLNNMQETINTGSVEILQLAKLIIRGGWPANINVSENKIGLIPKSYIDSILNIDMNEGTEKRRDKDKMKMLLKSLARNEASIVGNKTIIKDIEEYENGTELLSSRDTVIDYLDVLDDILEDVKHLVSL